MADGLAALFGEADPVEPAPRRRAWPWLVAVVVIAALAVGGWFGADAVARGLVTGVVRDQVVSRLGLPADHEVDVQIDGAIVPQLIGGRFDDVTIASDDVPVGGFVGDVTIDARGVGLRDGYAAESVHGTATLDEAQLRSLMAGVEGVPADSLAIAPPLVTMTMSLDLFGAAIPIGVGLAPRAEQGALVLSPESLRVADADITADDLRGRFGGLADLVLHDWTVCLADRLPTGVVVDGITVADGALTAGFDVDGDILRDPALRAAGVCP